MTAEPRREALARTPPLPVAVAVLCVLLVAASSARAAVPSPATVSNRVVSLAGGGGLGELTSRTTYTDTTATAIATPGALRLPLGNLYRIRTCVLAKAPGRAPQSHCESIETRPNAVTVVTGVTAPAARMTVDRPAAGGPAGTIAGEVLVDVHLPDNTYAPHATSWPSGGLPAAGTVVPAVGALGGTLLGPQGVAIAGAPGGGINSGTQDSICREDPAAPDTPSAGATDALGSLPFAYEVGEPPAGQRVRGVMIVLHGGAWFSVGEGKFRITRGDAERWRRRGWRTVNASYRACDASVGDVLALHDRVRTRYGAATPICAFGRSAGGHLALLLAARRPTLGCVVAEAGIADLAALASEASSGGATGPATVANWATAAFGADRLADVSAAGSRVRARVLYALAESDPLVPFAQATSFAAAQRRRDPAAYVDTLRLARGDILFEHGFVSAAGLQEFHDREQQLVAPLTIGDVIAPASARVRSVRTRGLRARFTCASRCSVTGRLELTAATARRLGVSRVIGRGSARRSSRGRGTLTIRLSATAKRRIERAGARLISTVTAGGARRRQTAPVTLRRP